MPDKVIQVNLKRFRQKWQLSQASAAAAIGIDQRQWNRYENGRNDLPVRYLKAICIRFKVSADWLLGLCPASCDQEVSDNA